MEPLKARLLKTLEANPLDFQHPPTQQEKDKPHRMCWVPDEEHFPEENPAGINSVFLLQQIMKVAHFSFLGLLASSCFLARVSRPLLLSLLS